VHVEKPREIAARVLLQHADGSDFIENLLAQALARTRLSPVDRRLCQELAYGVVRWQAPLDWLIDRKTSGRPQKRALQILLRLGLYQLFWLDRVPDHAAVNETVLLAKQLGHGPQAGFVNAVLRGSLREQPQIRAELEALKESNPALGWSHPAWLVERWQARWGKDATSRLLAWNNSPPATFARVNTLRAEAGKLVERWREEGVEHEVRAYPWTSENLVFELRQHPPLTELGSFRDGWFYIQDPSTLLAARALDPQPGDKVLDLCAAPGGKTTFIAQLMGNQGQVVAQDNDAGRLSLVKENCERLGVTCVTTSRSTEAVFPELNRLFERILVDAPCSNTGVVRRRVDVRWRACPEELNRLRETQGRLLTLAAGLLKPGGRLVYSTCSLEPEENTEIARALLANQPGVELELEQELWPFRDAVDGAYVARFVRR
jgi:16S rRNA (cytosine967-C5)-methyltransferase